MKKAEGLTLNTMAIAAIVLVVIIVTIAIFSNVTGGVVPFFKDRTECSKQTGVIKTSTANPTASSDGCYAQDVCSEKYNGEEIYGLGCDKKDSETPTPYCCIKN